MKKILIIMAVAMGLIACEQHENIKFDKTASEGIAGTYVGTWARTLATTTDTVTVEGEGTIVFTANPDNAYLATITASCAEPAINRTGITNVSHSDHEYIFFNNSEDPSAGFGAKFSGRVYKDNSIDMQYTVEEMVGRFKNKYSFSFQGKKQ